MTQKTNYTLTIKDLDAFEAEHIARILSEYKVGILVKKVDAMIEDKKDGGGRVEWYDSHLEWHEKIMKKICWD